MAIQIRPTLTRYIFSSSLARLTIRATAGELEAPLSLLLTIGEEKREIFGNTYSLPPVAAGAISSVEVYGLDKVVADAIEELASTAESLISTVRRPVALSIYSGATQIVSTLVFLCRRPVKGSAVTFVNGQYLSAADGVIPLAPGDQIELYWLSAGEDEGIERVATTLAGGTISTARTVFHHYTPANHIAGLVTSAPSAPGTASFLVGGRSRTYRIDDSLTSGATCFRFVNSFGVPEIFYCRGEEEADTTAEFATVRMGGELRSYRAEPQTYFISRTGILNEATRALALDLFHSKQITVRRGGETAFRAAVITSVEAKYDMDPTAASSYALTWQYTEEAPVEINSAAAAGIFDNTFDDTYE